MKTIKIILGVLLLLFAMITLLGFLLQFGSVIRNMYLLFSGTITEYEGGRLIAQILFLVLSAVSFWGGIKLIRKNVAPAGNREKMLDQID